MNDVGDVVHNRAACRFELSVAGLLCRADYLREGDVLNVVHTEVPPALEGRGLASRLVSAVFAHARAHALRVRPSCSYVRAWARRHPEVTDLLDD
jgi:predicted GNAT family acetyltransferase